MRALQSATVYNRAQNLSLWGRVVKHVKSEPVRDKNKQGLRCRPFGGCKLQHAPSLLD